MIATRMHGIVGAMTTATIASVATLLLTGCGNGTEGTFTDAARSQISTDVSHIDAAARAHNANALSLSVAQLQADLAALQRSGAISTERASAILTAATRVSADLAASPKPSPSPTVTPVAVVEKPKEKGPAGPKPEPPGQAKKKHH